MTGQSEIYPASGIHALINLDGSPVDDGDARILGLTAVSGPITAAVRDAAQPKAVHQRISPHEVALLAGFLDEPQALAASLGLSNCADQLTIALHAWHRYGADMPFHALGEWSFLLWRADHGVDLVSSMPRRDRICFARIGQRLAIAPNIWDLARIPWIGQEMDETGFHFAMQPYHVRQGAGLSTALAHVRQLPFGTSITISRDGERVSRSRGWSDFDAGRFKGSQRDGVAEAEALLLRVVRQHVDRSPQIGVLLSGGLDSSLIASLLSTSLGHGRDFPCFTSVAPPGSGLTNEHDKSQIVGDALGLTINSVLPSLELSPYRPSPQQFVYGNGAMSSPRHYLYQQFANDAAALGVRNLFDGIYGECTVTARNPIDTIGRRLRSSLRQFRNSLLGIPARTLMPPVRFAPHRIASLPESIESARAVAVAPFSRLPRPGELWQFVPGDALRLSLPTEILPGKVRSNILFRDIRLWRLFKSFPTEFAQQGDQLRAPARIMLEGRLPDAIRLQPKGLAFSPDYFLRLRQHAMAQAARIPLLRKSGADDWFDLDWLDDNLRLVSEKGVSSIEHGMQVQLTATNAEMLRWWRNGMIPVE